MTSDRRLRSLLLSLTTRDSGGVQPNYVLPIPRNPLHTLLFARSELQSSLMRHKSSNASRVHRAPSEAG